MNGAHVKPSKPADFGPFGHGSRRGGGPGALVSMNPAHVKNRSALRFRERGERRKRVERVAGGHFDQDAIAVHHDAGGDQVRQMA